jgi:hypothetical protein
MARPGRPPTKSMQPDSTSTPIKLKKQKKELVVKKGSDMELLDSEDEIEFSKIDDEKKIRALWKQK